MELLFWSSIFMIGYAYVGYPLSLMVIKKVFGHKEFVHGGPDQDEEPSVCIIIAAANEQSKIAAKLTNTINLKYPRDKLSIIITLDGATDETASTVKSYAHLYRNTELKIYLIENEKGGKENAQLAAVRAAKEDILVFTDTATKLEPYTLYTLVSNFTDPRVGAVDGMSKIKSNESSEGAYLKYENKIRELESQLGSLVTMGGCLFAVRREIVLGTYNGIAGFAPDKSSDFRVALITKMAGYQAVLDTQAVAVFSDIKDTGKEFDRKHRTVVRGLANFFDHLFLLNPFKYGVFSYQLFCHKMLKWLVPFFMISALTLNIVIMFMQHNYTGMWFWFGLFTLQIFGYIFAMLLSKGKLLKLANFFVVSNLAIARAWISYLKGERYVMWTPSKR